MAPWEMVGIQYAKKKKSPRGLPSLGWSPLTAKLALNDDVRLLRNLNLCARSVRCRCLVANGWMD